MTDVQSRSVTDQMAALHEASFSWALHCCHYNRDQAEEVLQNVYLKVLDKKAIFKGESTFKTWLFSVIRITAQELFRTQRSRFQGLEKLWRLEVPVEQEKSDGSLNIRSLFSELSDKQAQLMELVFYHDLTLEEAAQTMGITMGTASTHYKRAKEILKQKLKASA